MRLADDLDVPAVRYQGNWIPHQMRAPVEDGIFFVGDSAGHCLPTTAEGIRTALYFGLACGRELRLVLEGRQTREQALTRYADFCEEHRWAFTWLLRVQRWVGRLNPYPAMTSALEADGPPVLHRLVLRALPRDRPARVRHAGPPERLKNAGAPAEHLGVVLRSLPSLLLRPAIAGLNRLRLARKLVVIALVLIAPALYATWQFRSQQNAQIAFSAKERVGIEEIVPAQRLLADLATAQSLAVARRRARRRGDDGAARRAQAAVTRSIAAIDAADARLGSQLGTRAMWKRLRTSIRATLAAEPVGATRDARRLRPPHRRHRRAHRAGRQRVQPDPRSRPRLVLRDGRAGQQGAARARRPPGGSAAARSPWSPPGTAPRPSGSRSRSTRACSRAPSTPSPPASRRPTRTPPTRRCAPTLDPALAQLSGATGRSRSSSRARCTAAPTGPPRRSSARTRSPAPPRCRRGSPPRSTGCSPPASTTCAPPPAAPTSSWASASRSPPTSSWPSSSP